MSRQRNVKAVLLDKCNHNAHIRNNTYAALNDEGQRVFVLFLHPDDTADSDPGRSPKTATDIELEISF